MMPPAGVNRACDAAARKQGTHWMASQIAAVIPSRAIRRVALSTMKAAGSRQQSMRDQPVVIQNSSADEHVVLRGLILTA